MTEQSTADIASGKTGYRSSVHSADVQGCLSLDSCRRRWYCCGRGRTPKYPHPHISVNNVSV